MEIFVPALAPVNEEIGLLSTPFRLVSRIKAVIPLLDFWKIIQYQFIMNFFIRFESVVRADRKGEGLSKFGMFFNDAIGPLGILPFLPVRPESLPCILCPRLSLDLPRIFCTHH
jgi:hypothetical protein